MLQAEEACGDGGSAVAEGSVVAGWGVPGTAIPVNGIRMTTFRCWMEDCTVPWVILPEKAQLHGQAAA